MTVSLLVSRRGEGSDKQKSRHQSFYRHYRGKTAKETGVKKQANIAGVNDSPQDAEKVALLLKNLHCKLNLILFNEFPGSEFKTPTPEAVATFQQVLLKHHYTTIIRASRGSDILAACGQLTGQSC